MKFTPTELADVILVEPDVHRDSRGFFLETYHASKYREGGISLDFVQDNQSYSSSRGTVRGLHAQLLHPQGKLVYAISGEIWDVAVDLRPGSPTFKRWVARTLSGENRHQLYVPPGFVHGFAVLSDAALVQYKCTDLYRPADEIAVRWDDPELAIAWPVEDAQLNDKDRRAPHLAEIVQRFEAWRI
jgi:dTDP-4-dehydrorhamnose 3,5-epimerase